MGQSESRLGPYILFALLAAAVGGLAALGVVGFETAIAQGPPLWQAWTAHTGRGILVLLPALGGLGSGLVQHLLSRSERSTGIPSIIEAAALRKGYLPARPGVTRVLAAVLTLFSGGSAGSTNPDTVLGATLASWIGQRLHLSGEQLTTLLACGAAAAVSASFNAPLSGILFALEVILGGRSGSPLGPIILASISAAWVDRGLRGSGRAFSVPPYAPSSPWIIVFYLILGILAAPSGPLYILVTQYVARFLGRIRLPSWLKPALGGLSVGLVALAFPQVMGVGGSSVQAVLSGALPSSASLLLGLALLKLLLTSFTLTSGGSGGIVSPSIFSGAMLGGAYGAVVQALFPSSSGPATAYMVAGIAAVLAATTHAPLTAALLALETTRNYPLALLALLASAVSNLVSRKLDSRSVFAEELTL
jgi:CIC family chloride channel protein